MKGIFLSGKNIRPEKTLDVPICNLPEKSKIKSKNLI